MRILTFEEKITDDKTTDEWIDEWDCNERFQSGREDEVNLQSGND